MNDEETIECAGLFADGSDECVLCGASADEHQAHEEHDPLPTL